jgi:D-glycero-D-manno-heptose 1,7-bisphosphate phosphatase
MHPAVFLDRDGVLNPVIDCNGEKRAPNCLSEFRFFDGVERAVSKLAERFKIVVITNQPGVQNGQECRGDVEKIHDLLRDQLPILEVLTCFHDERAECNCRKPKPGLFLEAGKRFGLDPVRSFNVGDHWVDIAAGKAAGCRYSLLISNSSSELERCPPDAEVASLLEAADLILDMARLQQSTAAT